MALFIFASMILIVFPFSGFTQDLYPTEYLAEIKQFRTQKDSVFKYSPDSPLRNEQRLSFDGLDYFPIDKKFRLIGQLHRYARLRRIKVPSTDGNTITMERFGRIYFQWAEKNFLVRSFPKP